MQWRKIIYVGVSRVCWNYHNIFISVNASFLTTLELEADISHGCLEISQYPMVGLDPFIILKTCINSHLSVNVAFCFLCFCIYIHIMKQRDAWRNPIPDNIPVALSLQEANWQWYLCWTLYSGVFLLPCQFCQLEGILSQDYFCCSGECKVFDIWRIAGELSLNV